MEYQWVWSRQCEHEIYNYENILLKGLGDNCEILHQQKFPTIHTTGNGTFMEAHACYHM